MNYRINWDICDGVFAVPEAVVDSSLKLASGKAVKVLLYLLKNRTLPENPSEIGVTDEDIEDAVSYWTQVNIISETDAQIIKKTTAVSNKPTPIQEDFRTNKANAAKAAAAEITEKATANIETLKPRKSLLPSEIADRIAQSDEIAFLFKSSEATLKRVLTFDDQRTILWFYDHLGLSADIIIMLIAYCCSIGKTNMQYIEKIAMSWNEKNITTHEQAENEILLLQKAFSFEGRVQSRLKLPNKLSAAQKKYIDDWAMLDISIDLVELAYDKTVDSTGKAAFGYMNKILLKWQENNITEVSQAEAFDERTKPQRAMPKNQGKFPAANAPAQSAPSFDLSLIMEQAKNSKPKI